MKCEAHITIDPAMNSSLSKSDLRCFVETNGWTFSSIENDPIYGDKIFYYATMTWKTVAETCIRKEIERFLNSARLNYPRVYIKRAKAEVTIYDSRDYGDLD